MNNDIHRNELLVNGFTILPEIYSQKEIEEILSIINEADSGKETFRRSADLFAIRQFLKEVPSAIQPIFNEKLKSTINNLFGENYFVVKSIYFDKPETSNWYVAYHQDLTISVDQKAASIGFGSWTSKQNQFAVQPPLEILQDIYTVRIHLDDTNKENGALKVIPGSHAKGIYRSESIDWSSEIEFTCDVPLGGIMIMKPLLLHSSGRTINNKKRRVIHIELASKELPVELNWSERLN